MEILPRIDLLPASTVFQQVCAIHQLVNSKEFLKYRRDSTVNAKALELIDALKNAEDLLAAASGDTRCEISSFMLDINVQWFDFSSKKFNSEKEANIRCS